MADTQTLRQAATAPTPFSTWLGVVLLFFIFGIIVWAVVGPQRRTTDYEQKRAADRMAKLKALHEQDAKALTGYAWVDKTKGSVRIPIDRAMELAMADLAKKKPTAAGPIATPAPETSAPAAGAATQPAPATSPAASSAPAAKAPVSPAPLATATPHAALPSPGVSPSPGGQ